MRSQHCPSESLYFFRACGLCPYFGAGDKDVTVEYSGYRSCNQRAFRLATDTPVIFRWRYIEHCVAIPEGSCQTMATIRLHSFCTSRSQWPRGLRRRSAAARLLRLWVRIPPGSWMPVCCECCVLSGRGLCYGLITRPEESYRLWCVVVCDLETSWMRRPWSTGGLSRQKQTVFVLEQ